MSMNWNDFNDAEQQTSFDLIPKGAQFERKDPADVDEVAATKWTRRNMMRVPLLAVTSCAMLTALALA